LAHIRAMETTIGRVLSAMIATSIAIVVSLTLAYIAHEDFGLSPQAIRIPAVIGAVVIAALVAIEFFGKKLRKLK
jgi:hypothetical protein